MLVLMAHSLKTTPDPGFILQPFGHLHLDGVEGAFIADLADALTVYDFSRRTLAHPLIMYGSHVVFWVVG